MALSFTAVMNLLFTILLAQATINVSYGSRSDDVVCILSEQNALLTFKQHLVDPSNMLLSWDPTHENCCKWGGIVCNNLTGHVEELHLRDCWLQGKINSSLLGLKHLSYLDLSNNDFKGIQIPNFMGLLVSLTYLDLTNAGFEGKIPHQLGNLSSLTHLGLGVLYAYAENLGWLSGLSSLQHLDMSNVNLSKASDHWLQVINRLSSLSESHLPWCELSHIIPNNSVFYANFTSLSVLDISWNNFNSFIPEWIFNINSLMYVDLSSNKFVGPFPKSCWNLTRLKSLNVASNDMNSSLAIWLSGLSSSSSSLVSLDLSFNSLQGVLPCSNQNLTALRYLYLTGCQLNSTIISSGFLNDLVRLEYLFLDNNNIEGVISSAIQNLKSLVQLELSQNSLKGEMPTFVGNLVSLVYLDLSFNSLEGEIPTSLGNLCNLSDLSLGGNKFGGKVSNAFDSLLSVGCLSNSLTSLDLSENSFTGRLTDQIAKFKNLVSLDLRDNHISGHIPESLGKLTALQRLSIGGNQLNGSLPESLGGLSDLTFLNISWNHLEGVVTQVHFANLTNLEHLYASRNSMSLRVSPNWIPPFRRCRNVELESWNLGPTFPMWLKTQTVVDMDLSNTQLSGIIPSWLSSLTIVYLNISHNRLSGRIPDILHIDTPYSMVSMSSNMLSGPLPRITSGLAELDLSNNSFSGGIYHFLCHPLATPNHLSVLHFGGNHFSGNIPDCWMHWPELKAINLDDNNLTGKIPTSVESLRGLLSLHLRNNSLSGEVTPSLQNCKQLRVLDLGLNELNGAIPKWMGTSLLNLTILILRSNKLSGHIPFELCRLTALQILDVADNNLSGSMPKCFDNLKAMTIKQVLKDVISYSNFVGYFFEQVMVVTKGREDQYDTILPLVNSLDLSSNKLTGEIPRQLTTLQGLISLNLSGNFLKGRIPDCIGNMVWLESLDLSRNRLSGNIAPSISSLTYLSYLNLSYNNLSGKIPLSTQLQSFDASSFIGNELCGQPLSNICDEDQSKPTINNGAQKADDGDEVGRWFHLGIGTGFAVGFFGVLAPLLFSTTWRHAYFGFFGCLWDEILYKYNSLWH
ncbi:receptor-like protein EIX1 [Ziziphus jujuba]|uniref:Receptor-like protein EIX1 n=1 Tax=Ziziphus jujuba TaxID=326968 RepID=A0ABM3IEM9_ZIZJJ|nr:receptor-like protein EIX1 [Ziziphus jujuba]